MNELEEAVHGTEQATAAYLAPAMAVAEAAAERRAQAMRLAAAQAEETRAEAVRQMRVQADLRAAGWDTAARTGAGWVEAYASAVEWRELDPRARSAAARIEEALRQAGFEVPDGAKVRAANRSTLVDARDLDALAALERDTDTLSGRAERAAGRAEGLEGRAAGLSEEEREWAGIDDPMTAEAADERRQAAAIASAERDQASDDRAGQHDATQAADAVRARLSVVETAAQWPPAAEQVRLARQSHPVDVTDALAGAGAVRGDGQRAPAPARGRSRAPRRDSGR